MKPEAQRIVIAEACGQSDRWTLMKGGFYYRPNAHGYTGHIAEAWILTEEAADRHTYRHDEPVTKHRAPLPEYLDDLNSAMTLCDHLAQQGWSCNLHGGTLKTWTCEFYQRGQTSHVHQADTLAEAICGAFLKSRNLWIEGGEG